jgi:hypothetical protein
MVFFYNTRIFWTLTKSVAYVSTICIDHAGLATETHWSNQCVKKFLWDFVPDTDQCRCYILIFPPTHFSPRKNEYILVFPPERSVYTHFPPGKISIYSSFPLIFRGKSEFLLKFPPHTQFSPFALIDYTRAITPIRGSTLWRLL